VGHEKDRPDARISPAQPRDQIARSRIWPQNLDVLAGKSRGKEPVGHRTRRLRRSALSLRRLDLDQLLQDVSGKGPVAKREFGLGDQLPRQRDGKKERRNEAT
jgi:hypothetical protein